MHRRIYLLAAALLLVAAPAAAQRDPAVVRVLDRHTHVPIEGLAFTYADQAGQADARGAIFLTYSQGDTLFLSHIAYGEWFLADPQVVHAIDTGVIERLPQTIPLQPVTVIALRPGPDHGEQLGISTMDRLSHDAGSVLTRTAAVSSIRKSGAYGFDPVMRGFKYDQLNIVIDGAQTATAACPNRMDPPTSQVAPNMMDEVEILKGPHSFRYGTAFGGTINFETTPVRFADQPRPYGRVSTSAESNSGIFRSEALFGLKGPRYDLAVLGSFSRGSDYEDGEAMDVPASFNRASIGTVLGLQPADDHRLTFSLTHNNARDTQFPALPMDLRSDKTWLFNAKHQASDLGTFIESWTTSAYLTLVDHQMDNLAKNLNPRMVNAVTDAETESFGGRTEGLWSFEGTRVYSGADVRVERADGVRVRDFLMGPMAGRTVRDNVWNGGQVARFGLFTEIRHNLEAFQLVISGRLEHNRASARDVNDGFLNRNPGASSSDTNPSFSIGGVRHFEDGLFLGAWLGRAQRSASLTERYINSFPVSVDPYDMLGSPQLDPEINNQLDISVGRRTGRNAVEISLFAAKLQDYISSEIDPDLTPTMPSSPGVRRFTNIDDALMAGFEATWAVRLGKHLEQEASAAYTYGQDRTGDEPLPEIAPLDFRYVLFGQALDGKVQECIDVRHVRKQNRVSSAFGESATPAFTVLDIGLTARISESMSVDAGARNALDEAYYEHLSRSVRGQSRPIHAPGRNFYVTLSADVR